MFASKCTDTSDPRHFGTIETGAKCPDIRLQCRSVHTTHRH